MTNTNKPTFSSSILSEIKFNDHAVKMCQTIPLEDARTLAKASMKAKLPIIECTLTAKHINYQKTVYAKIDDNHWVLVAIQDDEAVIFPIPHQPHETVWQCFKQEDNKWKWWSMCWGLQPYFQHTNDKFKSTHFHSDQNQIYCSKNKKTWNEHTDGHHGDTVVLTTDEQFANIANQPTVTPKKRKSKNGM